MSKAHSKYLIKAGYNYQYHNYYFTQSKQGLRSLIHKDWMREKGFISCRQERRGHLFGIKREKISEPEILNW